MNTYTIPVGPLHVALEEPMYFKVELNGETVSSVEITAGHLHRGVEYLAVKRTLFQDITLLERLCSLCSNSHPEVYCMSLEQIAGVTLPARAEYLRVIVDEIKRVASHLFNLAIMVHLIGFDSLFMHVMETREIMQDVKETLFGNRMDPAANCIGGVRYDLDADRIAFLTAQLDRMDAALGEIVDLYGNNHSVRLRTRGVGVLSKADAIDLGVVGPVARASGVDYDVRIKAPYAAYDKLDVTVQTEADGDVWSRAMVRLKEVGTAIGLIRQAVKALPDTPIAFFPHERPSIPAGEAIAKCEAPRGELIYYVRTDGSNKPERVKWRVPSLLNFEALKVMLLGAKVADIALIVNSIDPCIGCTER
jgi:Ni,Fe-hydrogenase III large subunit